MIPEYIHQAKQDLERLIAEAVGKFEAETGLYVFDIQLNQGIHGVEWSSGGTVSTKAVVTCEAKVKLP